MLMLFPKTLRLAYCASALLAITTAEADVGLGLSVKNDEATVYIPVTAGRFIFEPYFRASDAISTSTSRFTGITSVTQESDVRALGIGIFRLADLGERVAVYYGARLARTDSDIATSNGVFLTKAEGDVVAPTLGFEYRFVERFSVGAEVSVDHSEQESTLVYGPPPRNITSKNTTNTTRADVIFRFFF
jgi:hypothetical protein